MLLNNIILSERFHYKLALNYNKKNNNNYKNKTRGTMFNNIYDNNFDPELLDIID